MSGIREKINLAFERFAARVIQFRWVAVILSLVITGLLAVNIPKLRIETTLESSFHEDDETLRAYQTFRDQFGRGDSIVLMIGSSNIFSREFFSNLKQFHDDLKNTVPFLHEINSLANARYVKGDQDRLIINRFLENLPQTETEAEKLQEKALAYPLYRDFLITEKADHVIIVIKTEAFSRLSADGQRIEKTGPRKNSISQVENSAIIGVIYAVADEYDSANFRIFISGTPVYQYQVEPLLRKGMKNLGIMVLILTGVFMAILFGRVSGVFLPQFMVILSLIATLGFMSLTGAALTSTTTMLPAFLLAVGLSAPIHLLVLFYKFQKESDRHDAIISTLGHSGLPIVMTSVTTAVGLLSFSFTDIAPVAYLGIYSALGVLFCLILTLVLLPALIAILDIRPGKKREMKYETSHYNRILQGLGRIGVTHAWKTIFLVIIVTTFISSGIAKLNFSHNMLDYLQEDSEFKITTKLIENETKGFRSLEVIVDTQRENGIHNYQFMNSLEKLETFALSQLDQKGDRLVGKTFSIVDIVKEINQALNQNQSDHYIIPQDNRLIAQHLLKFENSGAGDLKNYTDSSFSQARFTAMMYWKDAAADVDFVKRIEDYAAKLFGPDKKVTVTGVVALGSKALDFMMNSLTMSYLVAILVITFLMVVLIGDLKLGLISMIPNLLPLLVGLGVMGLLDMPLNTYNLIGGSIVVGLAVDDTIHFFHNFRQYYAKSGSVKIAVEDTLNSTGRALLTTTLILVSCFWLRLFSPLKIISDSGLIMGLSLLVAFLADVVLAPALLTIVLRSSKTQPVLQH